MCARPADAGWIVRDAPDNAQLRPRRPYDVLRDVSELPDRSGDPDTHRCSVVVLAQGWPHDIRRCVEAVLGHAPVDVAVGILKIGDVHGGASVVDGLAREHPGRVRTWHVERSPGWGAAMGALLRADTAAVQVLLDPSTVFEGDAVTPLLTALDEPRVVAAGWRGVDVDLSDGWRSFTDAGPGEVDALLGTCRRTPGRRRGGRRPVCRRRGPTATPISSSRCSCARPAAGSSYRRLRFPCVRSGTGATTTRTQPSVVVMGAGPMSGSSRDSADARTSLPHASLPRATSPRRAGTDRAARLSRRA